MSAMFPKLEGLDSLARRDGVDIRPTLVRVLTDLYVQKPAHTAEEERHYTELVLRLINFGRSRYARRRREEARCLCGRSARGGAAARTRRDRGRRADPAPFAGSHDRRSRLRSSAISDRVTPRSSQREESQRRKPRLRRQPRRQTAADLARRISLTARSAEIELAELFFSAESGRAPHPVDEPRQRRRRDAAARAAGRDDPGARSRRARARPRRASPS